MIGEDNYYLTLKRSSWSICAVRELRSTIGRSLGHVISLVAPCLGVW